MGREQSSLRRHPDATNVTLSGQGADTVLSLYKNLDGPIVSIHSVKNFTLSNLVLDGEGKKGPLLEIVGTGVAGVTIRNVTIRNFKGLGIRVTNADGNMNAPVRFEKVVVEMNDAKGRGIAIVGDSDDPRGGRSYHTQFLGCELRGPFAVAIAIEQPINSFLFRDCILQKGTNGLLLTAKDTDWRKLQVQKVQFTDIQAAAIVEGIKPDAISQIQWQNPVFTNVKTKPTSSGPVPPSKGK
ncbi:MAG: hypothetical protein U1D30_03780 [Planctomycetota bacterium]